MIDSTDKDRLPKVKQQLNKVCNDQELGEAPILILFNKQDLTQSPNYMSPDHLIKELNLDELKDKMVEVRQICTQGCSAKDGDGIWEGIG